MTKKRKAGDGRRHSRNPDDRQRAQEARRAHQEKVRPLSPQIPRDSRQSVDFITHSIEDGTLYFTTPDNAWAVDAHDGRELWHYFWKTRGGTHIANRGLGMWNGCLYMATPDNYLVSLAANVQRHRDGGVSECVSQRWCLIRRNFDHLILATVYVVESIQQRRLR